MKKIALLALFFCTTASAQDNAKELALKSYGMAAVAFATEQMGIHFALSETPVKPDQRDLRLCLSIGSMTGSLGAMIVQGMNLAQISGDPAKMEAMRNHIEVLNPAMTEFRSFCDFAPAKSGNYRNLDFFQDRNEKMLSLVQKMNDSLKPGN